MRILFVVPRYHTNMIGWVKALKSRGLDVRVHAVLKGETENYRDLTPEVFPPSTMSLAIMKVFGEGGANKRRGFPKIRYYYKVLKSLNPDIIIVRDIGRWFSLLAAIGGRILGARIIIYSQKPLHMHYSAKARFIFGLMTRLFRSFYITPIEGAKDCGPKAPKGMYYMPFVTEVIGKHRLRTVHSTPKFLVIGKFIERKNHLLILDIIKDLKRDGYKLSLLIVGELTTAVHEEYYHRVINFIRDNDLQNEVCVKINVPHEEIISLYESVDTFVLPATNEPASISVLEAMGYGLPVISSNRCGTSSYIDHLQNGYIFKDNSSSSLRQALLWYINCQDKEALFKICHKSAVLKVSASNFLNTFSQAIEKNFDINLPTENRFNV